MKNKLSILVAAITLGLVPASLKAVTFTFDTGGTNAGGMNNTRTFTQGSLTVAVTAWSRLPSGGGISSSYTQSFVGQYGGGNGLGVTNDGEDGSDPSHKVDNLNGYDFLLFSFNQAVDINSIDLRSVGSQYYDDSDFRLWIGNTNVLTTLAAGAFEDNLGGGSSRTATVNAGNVLGQYILVGAIPTTSGDNPNDQFKIYNMNVQHERQRSDQHPWCSGRRLDGCPSRPRSRRPRRAAQALPLSKSRLGFVCD
jgi:hypothetical protein